MIVLIAAGGTPNLSFDPKEAMQTMTAFIAAAGIGDQPTGSIGYKTIFAVGSTLFVLTFLLNLVSIRLVRRFREVYERSPEPPSAGGGRESGPRAAPSSSASSPAWRWAFSSSLCCSSTWSRRECHA